MATCLKACEYSCQTSCEIYGQCGSCQYSCQTSCEISSQCGSCESSCQSTCERSVQDPTSGAVLTISNINKTFLTATVSGLTPNGTSLRIEFLANSVLKQTVFTSSLSTVSADITGLSSGTSYTISAKIYSSSLLKTLTKTATTESEPPPPTLPTPTLDTSATIKTSNSIQVTTNAVTGATTYYFRINGGTAVAKDRIRSHAFTSLQPSTQYYIEIKVGGAGYTDSAWAGYYATTLVGITQWVWSAPKTSGTGFNVTATEWKNFCNKINEVRVQNGLAQYTFTTSTTYIATGKDFYAWIFKEAATAINQINGFVNSECLNVSSGNDIYAWYFTDLSSALNRAIL